MKITKILILFLAILTINAKDYEITAPISKVTIFPNNAKISRTAKLYISSPGTHTVIIKDLSPYVLEKYIQVDGKGNATILAVNFQKNFLKDDENPRIKPVKDSLQMFKDKLKAIEKTKERLQAEKEFLEANKNIKGENKNLTVAEMQYMLAFYRKELNRINSEELKLLKQERQIKKKIAKLTAQLNELRGIRYAEGNIKIIVEVKKPGNITLNISYLVFNAGWKPEYVVKCYDINKPLKLTLFANVKQNTGIDWKNVPIEITTANPMQQFTLPEISPIYASIYQPYRKQYRSVSSAEKYEDTAEDFGFDEEPEEEPLPEMEQSHQYTSLKNTETYQTYTVNLKYTILSNNKPYKIAISETETNVEYQYFAIPKKNTSAFLTATIKNISTLALISAPAKIIYKNQYAGTIFINPEVTEELKIPLGIDKDIAIKYDIAEKYTKVKTLGTHIKEQRGYKIEIRNNKSIPIKILVKDQIPLPSTSLIEVEPVELSGGKYNSKTGIIEWQITVPPNKTKTIILSYTIKYPKGKKIIMR